MKIAVYAISKNEAAFVRRFCDSARDADVIVIADTGSTDETRKIANQCGAILHNISVKPWRFDRARDAALSLVPSHIDVCISLDLDEVLAQSWRAEIERLWKLGHTTRMSYMFDWSQGVQFRSDKIHSREGYRWHHPVHECLRFDSRHTERYVYSDKFLVHHLPDETKSRGQYLDLLRLAVKEDPHCHRNAFYFARELTFYRMWDEAIPALENYLANPSATWDHERSYAMRLLGRANEALGYHGQAIAWHVKSANECPKTREPFVEMAGFFYRRQQWEKCYLAAKGAISITDPVKVYTMDPKAWGALPHDLAAISAWNLGLYDEALKHGRDALNIDPADQRLLRNVEWFERSAKS